MLLFESLTNGKELKKGADYSVHTADREMELRLLKSGTYKLRLEFLNEYAEANVTVREVSATDSSSSSTSATDSGSSVSEGSRNVNDNPNTGRQVNRERGVYLPSFFYKGGEAISDLSWYRKPDNLVEQCEQRIRLNPFETPASLTVDDMKGNPYSKWYRFESHIGPLVTGQNKIHRGTAQPIV